MKKILIIAVILAFLALCGRVWGAVPDDCQYPTRPLVNGQCDNSDPVDPYTTIKGEPQAQPAIPETPATSTPDYTSDFVGK